MRGPSFWSLILPDNLLHVVVTRVGAERASIKNNGVTYLGNIISRLSKPQFTCSQVIFAAPMTCLLEFATARGKKQCVLCIPLRLSSVATIAGQAEGLRTLWQGSWQWGSVQEASAMHPMRGHETAKHFSCGCWMSRQRRVAKTHEDRGLVPDHGWQWCRWA